MTLTLAEPPVNYLPPQPSSSYGAPSSSYSVPSSSYSAPASGPADFLAGSGNGYHAVGSGYSESEGANLDPQLLHKIEEILLDEENHKSSGRMYLHSTIRYLCFSSNNYLNFSMKKKCRFIWWIVVFIVRCTFKQLWTTSTSLWSTRSTCCRYVLSILQHDNFINCIYHYNFGLALAHCQLHCKILTV